MIFRRAVLCTLLFVSGVAFCQPPDYEVSRETAPEKACKEIARYFRLTLGINNAKQGTGDLELELPTQKKTRKGCTVEVSGAYPGFGQLPSNKLEKYLQDNGWIQISKYAANGANGNRSGYFKEALCVIDANDNGGGLGGPNPTTFENKVTCVEGRLVQYVE